VTGELDGNIDAADIEVTEPPADWAPAVVDDDPDPADVVDLDEGADE
jgi:hypothetical protein